MAFIPDQPDKQQPVPYLEDVTSSGGWVGHTTTKSLEVLIAEVSTALGRLGGTVTSIQSGSFQDEHNPGRKRPGYVIRYNYMVQSGQVISGKIDVAGLPARKPGPDKEKQSRKMALYMLRDAFEGMWYMQQLSPGLVALMPFMLAEGDITFSQKFLGSLALPAPAPNDNARRDKDARKDKNNGVGDATNDDGYAVDGEAVEVSQ
jgi:hypothetical protein